MWPPSDPEIMLSASSNKAEITYCSVWAVAIVSALGVTEGSKENAVIWCSNSPHTSTSLCFYYLLISFLFFFSKCTLCIHFSAGLHWVLFCRVCLAMHWETISLFLKKKKQNTLKPKVLKPVQTSGFCRSQRPSDVSAAADANKAGMETPCTDPQLMQIPAASSLWHGVTCSAVCCGAAVSHSTCSCPFRHSNFLCFLEAP